MKWNDLRAGKGEKGRPGFLFLVCRWRWGVLWGDALISAKMGSTSEIFARGEHVTKILEILKRSLVFQNYIYSTLGRNEAVVFFKIWESSYLEANV